MTNGGFERMNLPIIGRKRIKEGGRKYITYTQYKWLFHIYACIECVLFLYTRMQYGRHVWLYVW